MSEDSSTPITGEVISAPVREVKVRTKRIRHKQAIEKAQEHKAKKDGETDKNDGD